MDERPSISNPLILKGTVCFLQANNLYLAVNPKINLQLLEQKLCKSTAIPRKDLYSLIGVRNRQSRRSNANVRIRSNITALV